MTCTCTFVTSGTASMGTRVAAKPPISTNTSESKMTSARWRTETSRTRSMTACRAPLISVVLPHLLAQRLALEDERAFDGDALVARQAAHDLHFGLHVGAPLDGAERVAT